MIVYFVERLALSQPALKHMFVMTVMRNNKKIKKG